MTNINMGSPLQFQVSAQYCRHVWAKAAIITTFIAATSVATIIRRPELLSVSIPITAFVCALVFFTSHLGLKKAKRSVLEISSDRIRILDTKKEEQILLFSSVDKFIQKELCLIVRDKDKKKLLLVGHGSEEVFSRLPPEKTQRSHSSRRQLSILAGGLALILVLMVSPFHDHQVAELVFSALKAALGLYLFFAPRAHNSKRWLVLCLAWYFTLTGLFSSLFWIVKIVMKTSN